MSRHILTTILLIASFMASFSCHAIKLSLNDTQFLKSEIRNIISAYDSSCGIRYYISMPSVYTDSADVTHGPNQYIMIFNPELDTVMMRFPRTLINLCLIELIMDKDDLVSYSSNLFLFYFNSEGVPYLNKEILLDCKNWNLYSREVSLSYWRKRLSGKSD